jgi:uncharacterized protein (TIGR02246 family)
MTPESRPRVQPAGCRRLLPVLALLALPAAAWARSETCHRTTEPQIAALFDRWNRALQSGEPDQIVSLYAGRSILLPTLSNVPRLTPDAKRDYFVEFMRRQPVGTIDSRLIEIDCNTAFDAGTYTFRYADGTATKARFSYTYKWDGHRWLITSHHSSAMPQRD